MRLEDIKPKAIPKPQPKSRSKYDNEAIANYAKTHTYEETAEKFGCAISHVFNQVAIYGIERSHKQKTPKSTIEKVNLMDAQGKGASEIMQSLGICRETYRKYSKKPKRKYTKSAH